MILKRMLLLLLLLVDFAAMALSQVYAPTADFVFDARYGSVTTMDKVFVFNTPYFGAVAHAALEAVSTDSTDGWDFHWWVYNPQTITYDLIPGVTNGLSSQIDTITVSSGYQVEMSKGLERDTFRVWIVINDLGMEIINKDDGDTLLFGYYNCSSLDLRADTTRVPLFYYNPGTGEKQKVQPILKFTWTTDNPDAVNPSPRLITRVNNPPWADTWYKLTVTDVYGLARTDSVFYESIKSKAGFTVEYIPLYDGEEYPGSSWRRKYYENSEGAPGRYRFDMSSSENMAGYELIFGDGDTLKLTRDSLQLVHEYKLPGTYTIVLTTKSDLPYECIDSISREIELSYATAENFEMPNVFTPNNDWTNDTLRCLDVSVDYIDIAIFSRSGLKVYEYAGSMFDWRGWDGNIKNTGREAPVGVYYYVISLFRAYEDPENKEMRIPDKSMRGFVHLYR